MFLVHLCTMADLGFLEGKFRFRQITVIAHTLTSCVRQGWWKHFTFLLDKYN